MLDGIIVFSRLLQFACTLVLLGLPLFGLYGVEAEQRYDASRRWPWLRHSMLFAALGALLGTAVWTAAQAALFFPNAWFFDPESLQIILTETGFGRVTLMRAFVLAVYIPVILSFVPNRAVLIVQSALGAVAVSSFAWAGHGVYDSGLSGLVHTGADVLHLLTASVWVGALIALGVLIVRSLRVQSETGASAVLHGLERFSGIGPVVVSVLVLTGIINSWFLIGIAQWPSLFTTAYGIALSIKIVLFGGMLLLAAVNRYQLSPQLAERLEKRTSPEHALRKLRLVVMIETCLSIAVLAAVAFLGTWEPPGTN